MKKKIVGIFVFMLLTTTTVIPAVGTMNIDEIINKNSIIEVHATIDGVLNNATVAGNASITFDTYTGWTDGFAHFSEIDSNVNVLAFSSCSLLCAICCNFCLTSLGAENLYNITGGNFEVTVHFADYYNGSFVGDVNEHAIVTKVTDNLFTANISLNGWYCGPMDLVGSPGYNMSLQQKNTGEIEGTYSHSIFCSDGTAISCDVTRLYQYNTTKELPFDEIVNTTIEFATYENQTATFRNYAIYEPAASITIEKPINGIYFWDKKIIQLPWTLILGRITIVVKAEAPLGVDQVEFYIDNELRYTAINDSYTWLWTGLSFGSHVIKIIGYDKQGNDRESQIKVWKFF